MRTTVDQTAPVVAEGSIDIEASAEAVWKIVSDIERWPEWNPDVSDSALDGDLVSGSTFTWKAGPGTIRSTLLEVDPPKFIAWKGKTMGISAVHTWEIEDGPTGVRLITRESWKGLPARLLRSRMRKTLEEAVDTGLEAVKSAAESSR